MVPRPHAPASGRGAVYRRRGEGDAISAIDTLPSEEDERLAAVRRYDILDTPPDGSFDRITRLAARLFDVPISTITIVDSDRIWFKSAHGIDVHQIDRDPGLCASVVLEGGPYVVADALIDPRTLDNPLVRGDLGLRFYAGIPLTTEGGHNLGTMNIIDVEPREISRDEMEVLRELAGIVVDELELRLQTRRRVRSEASREAARIRDHMLAAVSHEMRTPMAVLRGMLELPETAEDTQTMWPALRRQVTRLDWLVNQFLDFATIQDGGEPNVRPRPSAVEPVVREAVDAFTDQATIELDVGEVPPALIDADRVRQILLELIDHAARSAGPDAILRVVVRDDEGAVAIEVRFDEPYVRAADLERLFEPVGRGRGTAGTGVGMFVSRELAAAQGGGVEVEDGPGDEVAFVLVVPVAGAQSGPR